MITQQQIDKLRRYLTGQIRTAVENQKDCIGTYYRNKGIPYTQWLQEGGDRDDEYEIAPTVVVQHNWFDTPGGYGSALVYDLYIAPDDGQLCFRTQDAALSTDWQHPSQANSIFLFDGVLLKAL